MEKLYSTKLNKILSFVLCCTMIFSAIFVTGGTIEVQAMEDKQLKSIFSYYTTHFLFFILTMYPLLKS